LVPSASDDEEKEGKKIHHHIIRRHGLLTFGPPFLSYVVVTFVSERFVQKRTKKRVNETEQRLRKDCLLKNEEVEAVNILSIDLPLLRLE